MRLFVTVGTTRFDALIAKFLTDQNLQDVLTTDLKVTEVVLQIGNSPIPSSVPTIPSFPFSVEFYKYKTSIESDIRAADIVVSHAGAGTCLEVLRHANKTLIIVVNESLMGNHQLELAERLQEGRHAAICKNIHDIGTVLKGVTGKTFEPFPKGNPRAFAEFVDNLF